MGRPATAKQLKWLAAYLGAADGNATEAARQSGYTGSQTALQSVGFRNRNHPEIAAMILISLNELGLDAKKILQDIAMIATNQKERAKDRLSAYKLLGSAQGLWRHKVDHSHQVATYSADDHATADAELDEWKNNLGHTEH